MFYVLSVFVVFFTRKIFLDKLGVEFMGLTGTVGSILNFLNLAELGVSTAIGFALYKPLFDNDKKEIDKIIALMGYLYKRVGLIILFLGLILSLFFGKIFNESSFSLFIINYCFYAFLISSLLGYNFNYHQSLLYADQKGYLINSYLQGSRLVKQLLQAFLAFYYQDFILWISLELVFSIIYTIIIRYRIKKIYPWLNINANFDPSENRTQYEKIIKKVKQIFVHKISTFISFGTDQILIFALVNIKSVALFDNYNMIIIYLNNLIAQIFGNTNASVGNLVAENNKKNIIKVFWELIAIRFLIAGFIFVNLFFLLSPLIKLWLGGEYILNNNIILLILVNVFILTIRNPIDNFINAYGLFADTWAPIAQIIINLLISIYFGYKWGIAGIMFGTTVSMTLIIILWKTYYLFNSGFKKNVFSDFWLIFIKHIMAFTFAYIAISYIYNKYLKTEILTFLDLILAGIKTNLLLLLIFVPVLVLFSKGFRDFSYRLKKYSPFS
ncbi:lipopolysaccharide biosynthesis protein [Jejuia pallidilutea]|uniref:lipopolysaccharide biosynthesis protein n=1 Tax=Jejuia pallidilutea TaxID=504487 RepID=UPI0012699D6E|nr:sugar transporter [Jejuia pallidilutea]